MKKSAAGLFLVAVCLILPSGIRAIDKVEIVASEDSGLEGRPDLRQNNNGGEELAVVGQNDAKDASDCSRALFRFDLSEYQGRAFPLDGQLVLSAQSISAELYGNHFSLYLLNGKNATWIEGVGKHGSPGKLVKGVAWSRRAGTPDKKLKWEGDSFLAGSTLIQSLKYGPGFDIEPGSEFVFTIPRKMLDQAAEDGVLSLLLMSDVEGRAVRAAAYFATRENANSGKRPRLIFGEGELLSNGIRLPLRWPPRIAKLDRKIRPVPYLENPPQVISINMGRQLFVDDFLIEKTTLQRKFYQAEFYPDNPILKPEKEWEGNGAIAYSGGAWYDPQDELFKLWYQASYSLPRATCLVTSKDGIHWSRPEFDVRPGTNVVLPDPEGLFRDSVTVWLDLDEKKPERRYKLWRSVIEQKTVGGKTQLKKWLTLHFSPDGIHWKQVGESPTVGDRTTAFYNPFRKVWVLSLRSGYDDVGRARDYREHPDALAGIHWEPNEQFKWVCADERDPHNPNPKYSDIEPQLYNLDAVAYESLQLGLFSIWQGDPRKTVHKGPRKRNELFVGFSRDGFHWDRPSRERFAGVNESPGAWNWGNVQSVGGCCLVVGDKLYFYVSGRGVNDDLSPNFVSTGLAILRRDGFASMDAGAANGVLTTRPVRFEGKHLFVNVDSSEGELEVEVLDEQGNVVEPFTRGKCIPFSSDSTLGLIKWKGVDDLSLLRNKVVKFRFHLRKGSLYSFWVSPEISGASHGYVAAGGPGFTRSVDTVGEAAYKAARRLQGEKSESE